VGHENDPSGYGDMVPQFYQVGFGTQLFGNDTAAFPDLGPLFPEIFDPGVPVMPDIDDE